MQKFVKNRKTDWYMPNAKQDKKLPRRFVRDEKRSDKSSDTEPQWQFRNMLKPHAAGIVSEKTDPLGNNFLNLDFHRISYVKSKLPSNNKLLFFINFIRNH